MTDKERHEHPRCRAENEMAALDAILQRAVGALSAAGIPHYLAGPDAVQEKGRVARGVEVEAGTREPLRHLCHHLHPLRALGMGAAGKVPEVTVVGDYGGLEHR